MARSFQGRRMDEDRRDSLLSVLLVLVLERGFAALTMDDFAAHARCSKTTLYALGSSKETLVAALYRRFFREATEAIEERIRSIGSERERIADYLAGVGNEMSRMSSACYDDMIQLRVTRDIYEVNSNAAADRVRTLIEQGIAADEFRAANARFVGEAVWLLIEGILHGVLLQRTGLSSGQAYNEIGTLVLSALDKEPAVT
jgi:AcrR family transcriptional regulator